MLEHLVGAHVRDIPSRMDMVVELLDVRSWLDNLWDRSMGKVGKNPDGHKKRTRIFKDGSASASRPAVTQAAVPPAEPSQ